MESSVNNDIGETNFEQDSHPLLGTTAQRMLELGLKQTQLKTGKNQRQIAIDHLGYKSSVVLSHMALGRVPIPVDRVTEIATALDLDPDVFMLAVLEQRFPNFDFRKLFNVTFSSDRTVARLEAVAGCSLDELPEETIEILREVVAARAPRRRWLSLAEVTAMDLLRRLRPNMNSDGFANEDEASIRDALAPN